jgi:hypothetical protein
VRDHASQQSRGVTYERGGVDYERGGVAIFDSKSSAIEDSNTQQVRLE